MRTSAGTVRTLTLRSVQNLTVNTVFFHGIKFFPNMILAS